jgi:hypothetical protein
MWSYTDDEQSWLEPKLRQGTRDGAANAQNTQDYMPEYYIPAPELTVDHYRQKAQALRNEAISTVIGGIVANTSQLLRQLGQLSGGNHAKVEAVINELRQGTPKLT